MGIVGWIIYKAAGSLIVLASSWLYWFNIPVRWLGECCLPFGAFRTITGLDYISYALWESC